MDQSLKVLLNPAHDRFVNKTNIDLVLSQSVWGVICEALTVTRIALLCSLSAGSLSLEPDPVGDTEGDLHTMKNI